jgi:hypothetical protein
MSFFSKSSTEFGSCCKELKDSMTIPQQKFIFTNEEGVLFLTVGRVESERGTGWFDSAIFYCPFCGTKLQTVDEIRMKSLPGSGNLQ